MKRRTTISLIVIAAVVAIAAAVGITVYCCLHTGPIRGAIKFGEKYNLTHIRDNVFTGVTINADSYLLLNEDRKTGELNLVGLPEGHIDFIVTQYQETVKGTTFNIEFIYKNELQTLTATSTDTEIRFRQVQPSRVEITQENPDDTRYLNYEVTIMVFTKEVA